MRKVMWMVSAVILMVGPFSCDSGSDKAQDTYQPADDTAQDDTTIPDEDIAGLDTTVPGDLANTDVATDDVPALEGACLNETDQALLATDRAGIDAKARECGLGCLNVEDKNACSVTCIQAVYALSAGCCSCYAGTIICTVDKCLMDCLSDSSSPECKACQEAQGCLPEFYTCSGLTPEG